MASLLDPLETLRAPDTRVVLDAFTVKDGYVGHDVLLRIMARGDLALILFNMFSRRETSVVIRHASVKSITRGERGNLTAYFGLADFPSKRYHDANWSGALTVLV